MDKIDKIENFYITYPEIKIEEKFSNQIYQKKEFRELELKDGYNIRGYEIVDEWRDRWKGFKGISMSHQEFLRRYMSMITNYSRLLVLHEMGLGKTCTGVMIAESIYRMNNDVKIYVLAAEGLHYNWKKEIMKVCSDGGNVRLMGREEKELKKLKRGDDRKEYNNSRLRNVDNLVFNKDRKDNDLTDYGLKYRVLTYSKFDNEVGWGDIDKKKRYELGENDVIIIDEIQKVIPSSAKNAKKTEIDKIMKRYNNLKKIFSKMKNLKILLLSGTPMVNEIGEIAEIMNLLIDNKLEYKGKNIRKKFNEEYLNQKKDENNILIENLWEFKKDKIKKFKNIIKGHISFLKYKTDIERNFVQSNKQIFKNIKPYILMMNEEQKQGYTWSHKGGNNVNSANDIKYNKAKIYMFITIKYKEKIESLKLSKDEIKKYSPKYSKILEILENEDNKNKKIFMYSSTISNGGLLLLHNILKQKYKVGLITGTESIMSGQKKQGGNKITRDKIINTFNKKDNWDGKSLQILLGSEVLQEGITLKDTQICIIIEPEENYSRMSQIMARVIRVGVHDNLKQKLGNKYVPKVDFYLLCLLSGKTPENSIDYRRYRRIQNKDLSIQNAIRILMESAIDCQLNKKINIGNKPFEKECEYQECDYKCDDGGINTLENKQDEIDYSSYNLEYFKDNSKNIQYTIRNLYNYNQFLTKNEIDTYLEDNYSDNYNCWQITNHLNPIFSEPDVKKNYNYYLNMLKHFKLSTPINKIISIIKNFFLIKNNFTFNNLHQQINQQIKINRIQLYLSLKEIINNNIFIYNKYNIRYHLDNTNNIYYLKPLFDLNSNIETSYYVKYPIFNRDENNLEEEVDDSLDVVDDDVDDDVDENFKKQINKDCKNEKIKQITHKLLIIRHLIPLKRIIELGIQYSSIKKDWIDNIYKDCKKNKYITERMIFNRDDKKEHYCIAFKIENEVYKERYNKELINEKLTLYNNDKKGFIKFCKLDNKVGYWKKVVPKKIISLKQEIEQKQDWMIGYHHIGKEYNNSELRVSYNYSIKGKKCKDVMVIKYFTDYLNEEDIKNGLDYNNKITETDIKVDDNNREEIIKKIISSISKKWKNPEGSSVQKYKNLHLLYGGDGSLNKRENFNEILKIGLSKKNNKRLEFLCKIICKNMKLGWPQICKIIKQYLIHNGLYYHEFELLEIK